MQTQAVVEESRPKRCHTKIAGTTFEGRQRLLAICREQQVSELEMVRDPDNRYDPHAVALEAVIRDGSGSPTRARLGFISNSDRVCSDCGAVVGGVMFEKTRRLRCPECGYEFGYDDPVVTTGGDGIPIVECPGCRNSVDIGMAKVVMCPGCGGTDFGRGGLATRFSRAMAAGVRYEARVTEYTGGDKGTNGKTKTLGCNILIRRMDE